jgi:hypothetical protein
LFDIFQVALQDGGGGVAHQVHESDNICAAAKRFDSKGTAKIMQGWFGDFGKGSMAAMDIEQEYDESGEDPPATPAATLVIFRRDPTGGPPQILMVERSAAMKFAGGAAVFPGGRVDDAVPVEHVERYASHASPHIGRDTRARLWGTENGLKVTVVPFV